ncbi:hypothetical protein LCL95_07440 [Bacillus timonensis]|nr:hypothetical protein [Bacillus timonensis]
MAHICPLCNGFQASEYRCETCGHALEDAGKVTDYLDDYSAYMEIDGLKLVDGYEHSVVEQQCAHVFYCHACQAQEVKLIQE